MRDNTEIKLSLQFTVLKGIFIRRGPMEIASGFRTSSRPLCQMLESSHMVTILPLHHRLCVKLASSLLIVSRRLIVHAVAASKLCWTSTHLVIYNEGKYLFSPI